MTAANQHRYETDILDTSAQRGVAGDGGMGRAVAGCRPETRRLQRPASTRSRRNTFGCKLVNPGNYDIADKIREAALKGTAIAERIGSSWASTRRMTT